MDESTFLSEHLGMEGGTTIPIGDTSMGVAKRDGVSDLSCSMELGDARWLGIDCV